MKKWMALLLAGCLTMQTWTAVEAYGAEAMAADVSARVQTDASDTAEEGDGVLEVQVQDLASFPLDGEVTVLVSGSAGEQATQEEKLDFGEGGSDVQTARFTLLAGNYTVQVKAKKFADYTQSIQLEPDWTNRILVCAAKSESGGAAGWLRPGDVTGDGRLDQADTDKLVEDIRKNSASGESDINSDGKTDLVDLQQAVLGIDESQESEIDKKLRVTQAPEALDGTMIQGDIKEGALTLQPEDAEEEITEENPVAVQFTLAEEDADPAGIPTLAGMTISAPVIDDKGNVSNDIAQGEAVVTYVKDGGEETLSIDLSEQAQPAGYAAEGGRKAAKKTRDVQKPSVKVNEDGSMVLNFGSQIAVKRVTIRITGTKKTEPLVNIAKVEFVNNMEDFIAPPQLDIPVLNPLTAGDKQITASWSPQTNVTGYEVYVSGPVKDQAGNATQIVRVSGAQHIIGSINDGKLKNFSTYTVMVRSVNGDWSSPWSDPKTVELKPTKRPDKPDNVKASGGYRAVTVSWKDMDDSDGYMVYYKKSGETGAQFVPVVEGFTQQQSGAGKLKGTSYMIDGLEDETEYTVYVIGWNELGWSVPSLEHVAMTTSTARPKLPQYNLLNTSNGVGKLTNHIVTAVYGGHNGAKMVDSKLDEGVAGKSALGIVDDDYTSYWTVTDWDDGVAYPASDRGMTVTLDNDYKMKYITFTAANPEGAFQYARVDYWDSQNATKKRNVGASLLSKQDEHRNTYYIIWLDEAITANKVQISLGRGYGNFKMKVGEIHFHKYDSLEEDIMGLFVDEMHTTLRPDVRTTTIKVLEKRLEAVDEVSSEKHPLYAELKLELDLARNILSDNPSPSYKVHNQITASKDGHLGFSGLNAWQPLGRAIHEGESYVIYVWHNTKKIGELANGLRLIGTQQHAEAAGVAPQGANLRIGRNSFTAPSITSMNQERGGQYYIAYTGNNANDEYVIRVAGGSEIPVLDVYGKTGTERTDAIRTYVEQLEAHVASIESEHEERHVGTPNVDYAYDPQNCILNATDIMMREMMYSVPATQVWAGIANAADKVTKLDNALKAMEKTMTLFYQHKGLSDTAGTVNGNNALPAQHLNIRYMRMFSGAFMYASGNHIGIEWGSTPLASAPNDWSGLGWGIAHEIGHNINQGSYAVAEVTNNYFAQLLTGKTRYTYENVYKKVTSGTTGRASNVFTQLALYWQLHLAYDNQADDRHIYDNYEDQLNNLFFARMDTYSRNPAKAPKAGLTLNGGSDQNLMRLACAAANKNILPFFERWGMTPDEATIAYAALYGEPETKALYYVNEDARNYRISHLAEEETAGIKQKDVITTATMSNESNRVTIHASTNRPAELILGYEISRSMISDGMKQTQVIGFVTAQADGSATYVDTVASINNRVMEYEVRAVDKYLNYSNAKTAGSVKIQTDGILDKSAWTVETTMTSKDDVVIVPDEEDPDNGTTAGDKKVHSIDRIIDNDRTGAGTYNGTSSGTATITVDMHKAEQVTALKYQGSALAKVNVEVSADGTNWTMVKENYAGLTGTKEETLWFDSLAEDGTIRENWIGTYDARYVRLTIGQKGNISIQEIELCGPSGDNIEFMTENGQQVIGILSEDYKYGNKDADVIPAGSLIFTGTYKGNPAYNVVILYDTEGNVVGAKDGEVNAYHLIFAEYPENGNLGEMSDGAWVYYVEPGQWDETTLEALSGGVRAELYRVDNALTLEGERIVSDSKVIPVPSSMADLKEITLTGKIPE